MNQDDDPFRKYDEDDPFRRMTPGQVVELVGSILLPWAVIAVVIVTIRSCAGC